MDPSIEPTKILAFGGPLNAGDVTESFTALVARLCARNYRLTVVVERERVDRDPVSYDRVQLLRSLGAEIVLKAGAIAVPEKLREPYDRILGRAAIADWQDDWRKCGELFQFEAERIFGDREFDVVLNYTGSSAWWSAMMSRVRAGRRIIFQHIDVGRSLQETRGRRTALHSIVELYREYDRVVSTSSALRDINVQALSPRYYAESAAVYAGLLIDPGRIREQSHDLAGVGASCDLILKGHRFSGEYASFVAIGDLVPRSDPQLLLHAFRHYVDSGGRGTLTLCGDGSLSAHLPRLVRRLRLDGAVSVCTGVSNVYPALRMADAIVDTSAYSGQPFALLAAAALGTVRIGVDIPALAGALGGGGRVVERTAHAVGRALLEVERGASSYPESTLYIDQYLEQSVSEVNALVGGR